MPRPSDDTRRLTVGTTIDRIRLVSPAARAVHRAVMHAFATTGTAPDPAVPTESAGNADLGEVLAELHERDVIRLDPAGAIRAAYPFSARPTAHLVDIDGGPTVYAMCAIDALGMSAMLGRPVTIRSAEPRHRPADHCHRPQSPSSLDAWHDRGGRRRHPHDRERLPSRRRSWFDRFGRGHGVRRDELLH